MTLTDLTYEEQAAEMGVPEFVPWPKISRLNRNMIVTEKLDGTNACVVVTADGQVYAQSRKRVIHVGADNFGFAAWVADHADELRAGLGKGHHFGEWWGQGIQRGYGLEEKRFSLFNTARWTALEWDEYRCFEVPCCHVVPVLRTHTFDSLYVDATVDQLRRVGSFAAAGFMDPEGVVVFHTAANQMFKVTLEGDEKPKGAPA